MTYIELINEFWKQDRLDPIQALDAKYYFHLLDECNKRKWANPFELQTRITELSLLITRKTITDMRHRLKQRGMIDFVSRPNKPTIYLIDKVEITNPSLLSCFPQVTIQKLQRLQFGNTNGYNLETSTETLIEDIRLDIQEKEKPPKGGKKKKSLSIPETIEFYKSQTQNDNYRNFLQYCQDNTPFVASNLNPLTEIEFEKLKAAYGSNVIRINLENIENRKDLRKNYSSLYRTLLNWCKNGYNT